MAICTGDDSTSNTTSMVVIVADTVVAVAVLVVPATVVVVVAVAVVVVVAAIVIVVVAVVCLFSDAISDVQITKVSSLLDLLDSGDAVMADYWFTIRSVLADRGVNLVIPHFLSSHSQFTSKEVPKNDAITRDLLYLLVDTTKAVSTTRHGRDETSTWRE